MDHHSLRFDCGGLSVVVAGDAVSPHDGRYCLDRRYSRARPRQLFPEPVFSVM
jgi:hypothetical protein